jgi:tetratricopeptide (TPR) repeat protein
MFRMFFALLLLALPAAARADWYEASTPHFVVYADRDPDRLKAVATSLERFDRAIRLMVGQADAEIGKASRVTVFTVSNMADVQKLYGSNIVAGFFTARASGSVAVVPQQLDGGGSLALKPLQVLLHEYAHYLMASLDPNTAYPTWLSEGFAEFNATAVFGKDGSVTLGEPPLYRGVSVMSGNNMPIEKLLTANSLKLDVGEMNDFYARAWLLTHYLRIGAANRSTQLAAYIAALKAGKPSLEAGRAAFGNLRQLDNELEVYKKRHLPISTLPGERLAIAPVTLRKLSPGGSATIEVWMRSKLTAGATTAAAIYADARRAAAPYPDDADAQLVLAGAALDASDYAGAEAAADRALAADPKRVRALTFKATARMAVARKAGDTRPESWAALRSLLSAANRIDPRDPMPLWLYYRSYAEQRIAPPDIAKDGLNSAFLFAPYDRTLRLATAAMYLRERSGAAARLLLLPLAFDPHGRGPVQLATALVARIDAGDLDGAIALLDGGARPDKDGD